MVGLTELVDNRVTEEVHRSTSSGECKTGVLIGDGRKLGNRKSACRALMNRDLPPVAFAILILSWNGLHIARFFFAARLPLFLQLEWHIKNA